MEATKTVKTLVKELVPPIMLKLFKPVRYSRNGVEEKGSEQTSEYYNERFREINVFSIHYSETEYYAIWSVIAERVQQANVKSILEIGCGAGQLANLLHDKGITKDKYLGFDFSSSLLAAAKQACPEFNFVLANAFETDLFYTYDYNTVITTEFLEHVERDLEVIEKVRKGTRFLGSVPNFPMKSHVRHFNSTQEVYDRYSKYFDSFKVDPFFSSTKGRKSSTVYYLFEGLKR